MSDAWIGVGRGKNDSSSGTYLSPQKSPKAAIAVPGERTEFIQTVQPEHATARWKIGKMKRSSRDDDNRPPGDAEKTGMLVR